MKISAKKRKWLKRISILTAFGIIALVLIYNAIIYRFRDIVQLALDIETKSAYEFDAGKIDVKLFQGKLRMKNAFLKFRDSAKAVIHHDVKIPEVQLELESFADLILHGKLYIKDLQVLQPSLITTAFENQKNKHMTMQVVVLLKI